MNIVLVTQFFPPETAAGARRVGALADALSDTASLTVVTLYPSYPDPSAHVWEADSFEYEVVRAGTFAPHNPSLVVRAIGEIGFAARLALRALRTRPDVVVASSPSMFLGPMCLVVSWFTGAKFVWDLRDLTWEYAVDQAGGRNSRRLARVIAALMWFVARRASLILAATDGIRTALEAHGKSPSRIHVAYNRPSREILAHFTDANGVVPNGVPARVLYAGVIGRNQALEILLRVAQRVPEVEFALAGDGPERAMLEQSARDMGLSNLRFLGYVDEPDLPSLYSSAQVLFAQTRDTPSLRRDSVPSKLFEYMSARRPIVYAGRGAAADMLTSAGAALVVPPADADAVAAAVRGLISDHARAESLATRAASCVRSGPFREDIMAAAAAAVTGVTA